MLLYQTFGNTMKFLKMSFDPRVYGLWVTIPQYISLHQLQCPGCPGCYLQQMNVLHHNNLDPLKICH